MITASHNPYHDNGIKVINSSIEGAADEEISEEPDNAAAEIPAENTAEETAPETPVTTEQNPTTGVGITVIVPAVCLIAAGFARKRK